MKMRIAYIFMLFLSNIHVLRIKFLINLIYLDVYWSSVYYGSKEPTCICFRHGIREFSYRGQLTPRGKTRYI